MLFHSLHRCSYVFRKEPSEVQRCKWVSYKLRRGPCATSTGSLVPAQAIEISGRQAPNLTAGWGRRHARDPMPTQLPHCPGMYGPFEPIDQSTWTRTHEPRESCQLPEDSSLILPARRLDCWHRRGLRQAQMHSFCCQHCRWTHDATVATLPLATARVERRRVMRVQTAASSSAAAHNGGPESLLCSRRCLIACAWTALATTASLTRVARAAEIPSAGNLPQLHGESLLLLL